MLKLLLEELDRDCLDQSGLNIWAKSFDIRAFVTSTDFTEGAAALENRERYEGSVID